MGKTRLEAFSDGVIAIIITIMVLELKVPHGVTAAALAPLLPVFLSYMLSFVMVGIYWNNHHHLLHLSENVNGKVLWANLHLLFWLSLIPFGTGWMGENHFSPLPVALYGVNMLMAGFAYFILSRALVAHHGQESRLAAVLRKDIKAIVSTLAYLAAVPLSFVHPWVALFIYVAVAVLWLVPDPRIENAITH